jgi:hypothetical protein
VQLSVLLDPLRDQVRPGALLAGLDLQGERLQLRHVLFRALQESLFPSENYLGMIGRHRSVAIFGLCCSPLSLKA